MVVGHRSWVVGRALALTALALASPRLAAGQSISVLHIKVMLADADGKVTAVPRHALLISDNPASAPPRLVTTETDGTADVKLKPGNYTVESDRPVAFHGKSYQWTQTIDVRAGRDTVLELTAANAEVETAAAPTTPGAAPEADPWILLPQWQGSVVALWTPTTRASGFLIDAKGLIATSQRAVGTATSVEVQLTPTVKVAANILVADAERDVAVLWIDPGAASAVRPVPLGCGQAATPTLVAGQEMFAIGVPLRRPKDITPGNAIRVEPHSIVADFRLARGSVGGPVFTADGGVVGITTVTDEKDENGRADSRVVRSADVCDVVAAAGKKMTGTAPSATLLPVEPASPFPEDALKDAAEHRAGSLNPYQISTSTFDVAFITPVMIYGADYQSQQASKPTARTNSAMLRTVDQGVVKPLLDFRNWSDYVSDYPPVLIVRVTPKLAESFWTTVARGAAQTQGMAIPPIKRPKSGFSRMRAYCGDAEVTPIHPFKLEQRVGANDTMYEGLYVFDPGALGPQCASVKLVLYSEKEPDKADPRVVEPRIVQQIWQDFAPYRDRTPNR
jgi:hypothetical protein